MLGVRESRPERSNDPGRSLVSFPPVTMGRPLTKTCSMPSASAYSRPGAAGHVVTHRDLVRVDRLRVQDDEIRPGALLDPAAVDQPVQVGLHCRHEMDRLFEAEQLPAAYGLGEQHGHVVERSQQVEMGAGVGRADHRPRIAPDLDPGAPVVIALRGPPGCRSW